VRIVITGHKGQLGRSLWNLLKDGNHLMGIDIPERDITDPGIVDLIAEFRPHFILHPAAYTNVDGCEENPNLAYKVNVIGTWHVALAAQRTGAPMLYVSTNEVFPGDRELPYFEWDEPHPINAYARSKLGGECVVQALLSKFYIVRTAWVFAPGGNNFVTKIMGAAKKFGALKVVDDEFGSPTYAPDLAEAIVKLVKTDMYGIYHFTNSGACSRYEYALEILKLAGLDHIPVTPIPSSEWKRLSTPPKHSILANVAGASLGITLRPWQEALAEYFGQVREGD
jgi:dTDP-4-dehydrorhamnose reductase